MTTQTIETTSPRLYVGTYAKYNNGSIKGAWVDLDDFSDKEDFLEHCAEIHSDEADPEFMFQDFEGFPREFYDESSVSDELFEYVNMDEDDRELLAAYANCVGSHYATLEGAQDASHGKHDSEQDFAEQLLDDLGELNAIPEHLRYYFDYEAYARDLFINDFTYDDESGYVFSRN